MQNKYPCGLLKRLFDFFFAAAGIIIFLPLIILTSLFIKLDSKGNVFFIQERIGKNFKKFRLIKFRSMYERNGEKELLITINNDSRITRVGKFIRRYKIDEIPQLFNVLIGEMSFVGPRPEVQKYIQYCKDEFSFLLKAKPGITDPASIKYRDENSFLAGKNNPEEYYVNYILSDKIKISKSYIDQANLLSDVKIIFKTIFGLYNYTQ